MSASALHLPASASASIPLPNWLGWENAAPTRAESTASPHVIYVRYPCRFLEICFRGGEIYRMTCAPGALETAINRNNNLAMSCVHPFWRWTPMTGEGRRERNEGEGGKEGRREGRGEENRIGWAERMGEKNEGGKWKERWMDGWMGEEGSQWVS
jgi:hypothetical protein